MAYTVSRVETLTRVEISRVKGLASEKNKIIKAYKRLESAEVHATKDKRLAPPNVIQFKLQNV